MNDTPTSAAQAEGQADMIREELAVTLDQLKENLRPKQLANEALATTRAHTPEWLPRYWAMAQSPVGMAVISAAALSLAGALVTRRRRSRKGMLR